MTQSPCIFDYALLDKRATRALKQMGDDTDFLWQELCARLVDRLDDIRRTFPNALEIGTHHGALAGKLRGKYGIEKMVQINRNMATSIPDICASEELLPIAAESMNLVLSIASMQWVNDLPGCLAQIRQTLKPDGLFIALIPGEQTLYELRASLDAAMLAHSGGISPRISPMLGLKDAADLMQRAGFTLPVVDLDRITISYSSPLKLMHDLRAMGQTNALIQRSHAPLTRSLFATMTDYYTKHFPHPEGGISATFDIITLTGWAPHSSQAAPLARGSGDISMKELF